MDIAVLLTAAILDFLVSEPPLHIHPVFWFGKLISFFERLVIRNEALDLIYGAISTAVIIAFAFLLASAPFPSPLRYVWHAYLLFSAISVKSMVKHAERCIAGGIDRTAVQQIVSRDTSELNESQLCSAVIESVAENYVDGLVSPLFYFSVFGIGGAMVFKAVNTCDAMIGYRKGRYEYFGKFAARLDDALNYIPARVSLLFFEVLKRGAARYGLKNGVKFNGCSIAAMSYVLNVKLEKPGYYSLPGRDADLNAVRESVKIFKFLSLIAIAFFTVTTAVRIVLLTQL
ncbi:adenosylcobinamide-phosphate synthase CbiB [Archaeoglobus neptunius]|uniref:adenosylcobinamide-phosphate synthase CbiB n=1 Tax=Archaeoglobus neptunius TaxID=2798580 RepID=UPI001E4A3E3D|nr:adenosylcobinamide-phosphate synthase CbiB [Archaeoglobus neptunius]